MARRQARHYRESGYRYSDNRKDQWWINRPSSVRRAHLIDQRNQIRQDPDGVGYFSTDQLLPGTASWRARAIEARQDPDELLAQSPLHWADIMFLDRPARSRVIYNATVQTVAMALFNRLEDVVHETIQSRMSTEDGLLDAESLRFRFEPAEPGSNLRRMIMPKHPVLPSLGNRTRHAAEAEEMLRLAANPTEWPVVLPGAQLERGYRYGVGVTLTVDGPTLSVPAMVMAIDRFRAHGCQSYSAPKALFDPTLIVQTMLMQQAHVYARLDADSREVEPPSNEEFLASVPEDLRGHLYSQSVAMRL